MKFLCSVMATPRLKLASLWCGEMFTVYSYTPHHHYIDYVDHGNYDGYDGDDASLVHTWITKIMIKFVISMMLLTSLFTIGYRRT